MAHPLRPLVRCRPTGDGPHALGIEVSKVLERPQLLQADRPGREIEEDAVDPWKHEVEAGTSEERPEDRQNAGPHHEEGEDHDGQLAVRWPYRRVAVDVRDDGQADESEGGDDDAGDLGIEVREKLLKTQEVPGGLRGIGLGVEVGELEQRCSEIFTNEISISKKLFEFTKQYLTEHIQVDTNVEYNDALACIPYLTRQKFGFGSEQSIIKYIKQLTSSASPWQIVRDDKGIRIICKRVLN